MSSTMLYVGRIDNPNLEDPVSRLVLGNHGTSGSLFKWLKSSFSKSIRVPEKEKFVKSWFGSSEPVAMLDALNLASISLFLEHTAQLEGTTSANAIDHSKWKNLPYWIDSIWLPIDANSGTLTVEIEGMPTFFGTAPGLLRDLAEIQKMSPIDFNPIPSTYAAMRQDPIKFFHSEMETVDDSNTLRWVWRALFDVATLANEHQLPAWTG